VTTDAKRSAHFGCAPRAATLASARDHGLWFAGDFLTGVGRIHRAIASGEATGAALVAALGG